MAQARSARAINRWKKKRGSVIYRTGRKNEANKMFIAAGHQPAADHIFEQFEIFRSIVQWFNGSMVRWFDGHL